MTSYAPTTAPIRCPQSPSGRPPVPSCAAPINEQLAPESTHPARTASPPPRPASCTSREALDRTTLGASGVPRVPRWRPSKTSSRIGRMGKGPSAAERPSMPLASPLLRPRSYGRKPPPSNWNWKFRPVRITVQISFPNSPPPSIRTSSGLPNTAIRGPEVGSPTSTGFPERSGANFVHVEYSSAARRAIASSRNGKSARGYQTRDDTDEAPPAGGCGTFSKSRQTSL